MTSIPTPNVGVRGGGCPGRRVGVGGGAGVGAPTATAAATKAVASTLVFMTSWMAGRAPAHFRARPRHLDLDLALLEVADRGVCELVLAAQVRGQLLELALGAHRREGRLEQAAAPLGQPVEHVVVRVPVLDARGAFFDEQAEKGGGVVPQAVDDLLLRAAAELR